MNIYSKRRTYQIIQQFRYRLNPINTILSITYNEIVFGINFERTYFNNFANNQYRNLMMQFYHPTKLSVGELGLNRTSFPQVHPQCFPLFCTASKSLNTLNVYYSTITVSQVHSVFRV